MYAGHAFSGQGGATLLEIVVNGAFLQKKRTTGVQRVSREILSALDRLLDDERCPPVTVRCVVPDQRAEAAFERLGCRNVVLEVAPGAQGHIWEQVILPAYVRDGMLLCLGNTAPVWSLLSSKPPAVMLHDQAHLLFPWDYSRAYRWFHRALEALIVRRAAPLLLVSGAERRELGSRHPIEASRAIVAPNGSWLADSPPADPSSASLPRSQRYGLFIGPPTVRKNIDGALAVAIELAREHDVPFRFVGPGIEMLDAQIPADLRALITLCGYVADSELPALYRDAAFLLYPSFFEASGLPPSEAMAFGCPVIAADLPVLRERCADAACYCDPYDRGAMVAAALRLWEDDDFAAALGRSGRLRAAGFTWDAQARLIVDAMAAAHSYPSRTLAPSGMRRARI